MSQKIYAFDGLWNENYAAHIQTKLFYSQSKVDLDEKILFDKSTHHLYPKFREMLERGIFGEREFDIPFSFRNGQ